MRGGESATDAFVAALRSAQTALREVPAKLEGARVHDFAFGKLFEATEVRDAYHKRLPETEKDVAEACEVLDHFIKGLSGGHAIGAREGGGGGASVSGSVSASSGVPVPSQGSAWTADTFPWCRVFPGVFPGALPEQGGSVEP